MNTRLVDAAYRVDPEDARKLELLFEMNAYLMSDDIKKAWINIQDKTGQFAELLQGAVPRLYLQLRPIQDQAEADFLKRQLEYENLTGFRPQRDYRSEKRPT